MRISNTPQTMPPLPSETNVYKATTMEAPGKMALHVSDLPEPGDEEVRVKLEGSGVCASNVPLWEGRDWFNYPRAAGEPGHEGWGIIDAVGRNVDGLYLRQRVTGLMYNAHATHDIAHQNMLVTLPDFLDDKPFPGEPLGCAMNIFERSDIRKGDTVAIVGCGFLGLMLIQLAKSSGATVVAVSQREFSLQMARSCEADHLVKMDDHYQVIEKIKELTDGELCQRVIECTGKEWPLNLAIQLTGYNGKLVVAGFHQDGMRNIDLQTLNWRGIDMINAHERNPERYIQGIKKAIGAIQTGALDPFPLITHTFSLEETEKAYEYLVQRPKGFVKALIMNS
ncbi:MDR/zinc-dependent alcohol dehydrogenase-like family protein [Flagellimonas baculiformis]|uniref:MDR/zinc-dependent alcohol dehydrogenase-like family protein n=1 Tax=Flagellimonas baculiformis TaxID=3067310 RepID=UPI00296E40F7|nr:zinc-binding dehydrogenase [Muricauda sp. D6]